MHKSCILWVIHRLLLEHHTRHVQNRFKNKYMMSLTLYGKKYGMLCLHLSGNRNRFCWDHLKRRRSTAEYANTQSTTLNRQTKIEIYRCSGYTLNPPPFSKSSNKKSNVILKQFKSNPSALPPLIRSNPRYIIDNRHPFHLSSLNPCNYHSFSCRQIPERNDD